MDNFENILTRVIRGVLDDLLGSVAAAALNFYIDPGLAALEPNGYASKLEAVVGTGPADVILRRIQNSLNAKTGMQKRTWKTFAECVNSARMHTLQQPRTQ